MNQGGGAIVLCATCNLPGRVVFGDDGEIKEQYFVCRCPRDPVTARAPATGKQMSPQADSAPHRDEAEQRVRSELRDGSPGPLRLADRSKARDGL